jgi:hypothetical protein
MRKRERRDFDPPEAGASTSLRGRFGKLLGGRFSGVVLGCQGLRITSLGVGQLMRHFGSNGTSGRIASARVVEYLSAALALPDVKADCLESRSGQFRNATLIKSFIDLAKKPLNNEMRLTNYFEISLSNAIKIQIGTNISHLAENVVRYLRDFRFAFSSFSKSGMGVLIAELSQILNERPNFVVVGFTDKSAD